MRVRNLHYCEILRVAFCFLSLRRLRFSNSAFFFHRSVVPAIKKHSTFYIHREYNPYLRLYKRRRTVCTSEVFDSVTSSEYDLGPVKHFLWITKFKNRRQPCSGGSEYFCSVSQYPNHFALRLRFKSGTTIPVSTRAKSVQPLTGYQIFRSVNRLQLPRLLIWVHLLKIIKTIKTNQTNGIHLAV